MVLQKQLVFPLEMALAIKPIIVVVNIIGVYLLHVIHGVMEKSVRMVTSHIPPFVL